MLIKYNNADFLSLRKKAIENEFGFLNPMQKQAVYTTEGPLLILAGAGSGKTTVLINRIANLVRFGNGYRSEDVPDYITDDDYEFLEEYIKNPSPGARERVTEVCAVCPAAPWSIIAITFTNKAAGEIKSRLEEALGDSARDIWASTFHSACMRILHRDIDRLGFDKSFTVYDTADSRRLVGDIIRELSLDDKMYPAKGVFETIGKLKDNMLSPSDIETEYKDNYRMQKIAEIYEKYQSRLKAANALDFDDIIIYTVKLLRENADILSYYQRKFRYVLIDEYQDTNRVQYLLASLLAGGHNNICVVGDDDQSIYKFRGATIENILQFEKQFKDARIIRLEQNYRSTSQILDVANSVIKNNIGRKHKKLWTDRKDGTPPVLYRAASERDEASFVANRILDAYSKGKSFRDFAVLYRTNAQSNQFESIFKQSGIPYRIIGAQRFFDTAEIKDMLAYLRVIQNPSDTLRLKRIINTPARKIGEKTLETAEALAALHDKPLFEIVREAGSYPELSKSAGALTGFANMIISLSETAETASLDTLYDELLAKSGYVEMLNNSKDEKSKERLENVMELKSNIADYEARGGTGLPGFLDEVSLFTDIDNYDKRADSVVLMTIHSAKGLEFPAVFITGAEDELFPSFRSISSADELEEERRLFYVAATRAKDILYITYAGSRFLAGKTMFNRISRFVEEIDESLLEKTESAAKAAQDYIPVKRKRYDPKTDIGSPAKPSGENPYRAGDRLFHKVFGTGTLITAQNMGGDTLLEIAFDKSGTKRLLYNFSAKYLSRE